MSDLEIYQMLVIEQEWGGDLARPKTLLL
jgi:hypothetical protein